MKTPLTFGLRLTIQFNALCAILPAVRYIFLHASQQGEPMYGWDTKYFFVLDAVFLLWLGIGLSERRAWARWAALVFYCADALGARLLGFLWGQAGAGWVITSHENSFLAILSKLIQVVTPPMILFVVAFLLSHGDEFKN